MIDRQYTILYCGLHCMCLMLKKNNNNNFEFNINLLLKTGVYLSYIC